jgi:hypothetical protein
VRRARDLGDVPGAMWLTRRRRSRYSSMEVLWVGPDIVDVYAMDLWCLYTSGLLIHVPAPVD